MSLKRIVSNNAIDLQKFYNFLEQKLGFPESNESGNCCWMTIMFSLQCTSVVWLAGHNPIIRWFQKSFEYSTSLAFSRELVSVICTEVNSENSCFNVIYLYHHPLLLFMPSAFALTIDFFLNSFTHGTNSPGRSTLSQPQIRLVKWNSEGKLPPCIKICNLHHFFFTTRLVVHCASKGKKKRKKKKPWRLGSLRFRRPLNWLNFRVW